MQKSRSMAKVTLCVTFSILTVIVHVSAKRNKPVYCGACIGLVQEMDWGLATTDGKKTLQVGSFRIDSEGKQALNQIPLKYSELHLTDLLEGACDEVGWYAESHKEGSDKVNYIRTDSRDGRPISLKNIQISTETQRLLKFACDTIVEEHEDEIIEMYKNKESEVSTKLCVDITGLCTGDNITDFKQAMDEMISDAILEEANKKTEKEEKNRGIAEEESEGKDEDEDSLPEGEQNTQDVESQEEDIKHEL